MNYLDLSPKIPKLLFRLAWLRTRKMPSVRCILETGAGHIMRHEPRLTSTRVAETVGGKERPWKLKQVVPHSQETTMVLSSTLWIFMRFMLPGWWNKSDLKWMSINFVEDWYGHLRTVMRLCPHGPFARRKRLTSHHDQSDLPPIWGWVKTLVPRT